MRKNRMSSSISLHFESRLNFLFYGVYDLIQQIYTEIVIFKLDLGTVTKKMKNLCFLFPFYLSRGVVHIPGFWSLDAFMEREMKAVFFGRREMVEGKNKKGENILR